MPLEEKCLYIYLFVSIDKIKCFQSIIDKMGNKLYKWQGKLVCQAGRSTKIQTVIGTTTQFHMGCFEIPQKSIKPMDAIQRRYR